MKLLLGQTPRKDYQQYFDTLYYEFKYRYGTDLRQRKLNGHYHHILDVAEAIGCIDQLYALAVNLFGNVKQQERFL